MRALRVARKADIAWRAVEDEALLVDPASGLIYPLNPVAARVWALLDGTRDTGQICAAIDEEFEGEKSSLARDLESFVASLVERGLAVEIGAADQ